MTINFNLHPKQTFVLETEANEILYGGAAGGGKSHLLRIIAIICLLYIPNVQIYLFRRLSEDLDKNHMEGENGFRSLLAPIVAAGVVTIIQGEIRHNTNGAKIHLCHCQHEKDRYKYQGAEMHVLLIDELTHFTETIYRFLRNRVRMPPEVPDIVKQIFGGDFILPKIICGSNPGNIGHTFVKQTFIDQLQPFEVRQMPREEGGMVRQYIPALLEDNPSLLENDPGYEMRLEGLGSPDLVRAMRYGLWDITAGAALEKLRRDKHMIRDFQVPKEWTKFMVIDWGSAKPFSVGWYCVVDDDLILKAKDEWPERLIPRGALIRYREYYGWNGKANEGCRLESKVVANQILDTEEEHGEEMDYRVGDAAMWAEHDGASVQENMYDGTNGRFLMEQSRKGRAGNFEEVRARIAGDEDGPMLYITSGCKHFWRTVPDLQLDERHPEKGPDTEQEDHCMVAGTKVKTAKGLMEIQDIHSGMMVLTTEGYRPCIQLGLTSVKNVYKIRINNQDYEATGNHPFLTDVGTYVRLDALCKTQKLYQIQSRFSLIKLIGYVANIINAKVLDCIALCGNFIMGKSLKDFIFIIKTIMQQITRLPTWSLSPVVSTCPNTPLPQRPDYIKISRSDLCRTKQRRGINRKKVIDSIKSLEKKKRLRDIERHVLFVARNLWQSLIKLSSAGLIVERKTGGARIQSITNTGTDKPVYNLHVAGVNNFVLEGGIVVHNCYDDLQYACASRPYITTKRDRLVAAIAEAKRQLRKNS